MTAGLFVWVICTKVPNRHLSGVVNRLIAQAKMETV